MPKWLGQSLPLPEEGVFKGVDLLVSITPPGLTLPLVLSLWKPGISFRDPHSNQPCFHGDPTIPHQLPSCHNNSRDYQLFPQPRALCDSPHPKSPQASPRHSHLSQCNCPFQKLSETQEKRARENYPKRWDERFSSNIQQKSHWVEF